MAAMLSGDSALSSLWTMLMQSLEHPIHFITELLLIALIVYLWTTKSYKKVDESLTPREEEQLIAEWTPEPLINPEKSPARTMPKVVIAESEAAAHVKVNGELHLNLVTTGFLGYQVNPRIKKVAIECTKKYGVGACGPRGFYGSIEPHMQLEKKLAEFTQVEDCVIFSSEFQTIASVIPAFAKPGDYLIVDKGVSMAIQTGVLLARSEVIWFNHNDMGDLKARLQSLGEVYAKCKHRVFLIVEGISANSGHILDLPQIMKFKETYPFRIILEESFSTGVLGKTGVGITQHYGIPAHEVEIICGSLGNSLGGVGGFALGSKEICNHMRLNCSGYVFSCSLPPYISRACTEALEMLREGKEIQDLQAKIKILHKALNFNNKMLQCRKLVNLSSPESALVHLQLAASLGSRMSDEKFLDEVVTEMREKHHILITRAKYVPQELFPAAPSLKITISILHTEKEIVDSVKTLNQVVEAKVF